MAKISGIYVEIRGDASQLKKELREAKDLVTQQAQGMSNALNNALSPAQLKNSINGLTRDLSTLLNASKLTGKEFGSLGVDLGKLRSLTGLSEAEFGKLQSRMLQTSAANAQEKALRNIAKAANLTKTEIQSLGQQMGVSTSSIANVTRGSEAAGGGMSLLAGGAKTVAAAFGVLSGVMITQQFIEFGKAVIDAGIAVDSLNRSYAAIFGGTQQAAREFEFVRKTALDTGQSFYTIADSYKQISASAKDTVLEGEPARQLFLAMSQAGSVLGLSNERMALSFKAFSDMMSKGTVQMEELKNQLGDNLPGALNIAAKGLGITRAEVLALAKDGKLMASEVIPAMTQELQRMYAVASNDAALNSARAAVNRLSDSWTDLKANLFDSQAFVVATNSLANMTKAIGGFFAADTVREKYTAAQDNLKGLEQIEGTPMASLPGFSGSIAKARKEVALLKAELDAVSNPLKADSWLSRDKGAMFADERGASSLGVIDEGRKKMLEYIQTARQKAEVERDTHLEFARNQEERNAILQKYADTISALDKKASGSGSKALESSMARINSDIAKLSMSAADFELYQIDQEFAKLAKEIGAANPQLQRWVELRREEAEITRGKSVNKELEDYFGDVDKQYADLIKKAEDDKKKNEEILLDFSDRYRAIVVGETEFKKEEIDKQAAIFRAAGADEIAVAQWVAQEKLAVSRDWQDGATRALQAYTDSATNAAQNVEDVMTMAFEGLEDVVVEFVKTGKLEFSDLVTSINAEIARLAFRGMAQEGYNWLGGLLSAGMSAFSGGGSAVSSAAGTAGVAGTLSSMFARNAKGGVYDSPSLSAFSGGIYHTPQMFAFARGAGIFAEAGPEAIMPLRRGPDGVLGVKSAGGSDDETKALLREIAMGIKSQRGTKVVNAIGKGAIANELSGSEGEQVIFNHIRRNPSAVRRMLGL